MNSLAGLRTLKIIGGAKSYDAYGLNMVLARLGRQLTSVHADKVTWTVEMTTACRTLKHLSISTVRVKFLFQ